MNRLVHRLLAIALLLAVGFAIPAHAQVAGTHGKFVFDQIMFRNTVAGSSFALNQDWTVSPSSSYADSSNFIKMATAFSNDTTVALQASNYAFVPNWGGGTGTGAVGDTAAVPWLQIHVQQDSLSRPFPSGITTIGSLLDTVWVAAQTSNDGINWQPCNGTPTLRFEAAATSPVNGNTVVAGVEPFAGQDDALVTLKCHPSQVVNAGSGAIINRTLCLAGSLYFRFVLSGDYSGRFRLFLGHWVPDTD